MVRTIVVKPGQPGGLTWATRGLGPGQPEALARFYTGKTRVAVAVGLIKPNPRNLA